MKAVMFWAVQDSWTMSKRTIKHIFRNPESLLISMVLPILLMLMFVYVFGGAINTGTDYINYVVPGIIITCIGYGSSMTAVSISQDMSEGLFDRLRSMPVLSSSLLSGHVVGSYVRNMISTALVFLVAVMIGFRPEASILEWLGVIAFISLFVISVSWFSIILGLLAKNAESASAFTFFILFLPYVSSAFVPTETMPTWLHAFADNQPMTPLIETLRGLLLHTAIENNGWLSVIWFGGLLVLSVIIASLIFSYRQKN